MLFSNLRYWRAAAKADSRPLRDLIHSEVLQEAAADLNSSYGPVDLLWMSLSSRNTEDRLRRRCSACLGTTMSRTYVCCLRQVPIPMELRSRTCSGTQHICRTHVTRSTEITKSPATWTSKKCGACCRTRGNRMPLVFLQYSRDETSRPRHLAGVLQTPNRWKLSSRPLLRNAFARMWQCSGIFTCSGCTAWSIRYRGSATAAWR